MAFILPPGSHLRRAVLIACGLLGVACGTSRQDVRETYAADRCVYHSLYFQRIVSEEFVPGVEVNDEQRAEIFRRARFMSRKWAASTQDSLELVGTTFRLAVDDVGEPPKGARAIETEPISRGRRVLAGSWLRDGSALILRVASIDGKATTKEWELRGTVTEDEVAFRNVRDPSVFTGVFLLRHQ